MAGLHDQTVLNAETVRQLKHPVRPRIGPERSSPLCAVGMDNVGRIALRTQRERSLRRLEPDSRPLTSTMRLARWASAVKRSAW